MVLKGQWRGSFVTVANRQRRGRCANTSLNLPVSSGPRDAPHMYMAKNKSPSLLPAGRSHYILYRRVHQPVVTLAPGTPSPRTRVRGLKNSHTCKRNGH